MTIGLEDALEIALKAHKGQKDKAGRPYILHPIRLMMAVQTDEEKIVALLHDVVEDSSMTLKDLENKGFSSEIIDAVGLLTRRGTDESYEERIKKISTNPIAIQVKIADLEDNMNIRRMISLTDKDLKRLRKYHKSWSELKNNTLKNVIGRKGGN